MNVGRAITEAMREQRQRDYVANMWRLLLAIPNDGYARPGDGSSVWLGRWSGNIADLEPAPDWCPEWPGDAA
jgi:hypothetical protein